MWHPECPQKVFEEHEQPLTNQWYMCASVSLKNMSFGRTNIFSQEPAKIFINNVAQQPKIVEIHFINLIFKRNLGQLY